MMPGKHGRALVLKETTDFPSMRELALESGLEDGAYHDFVKAFGFFDGEILVACAGLKVLKDAYLLECVAVKEGLRGRGLGSQLVALIEGEAKRLGGTSIWALARAPGFFERVGYKRVEESFPGGPSLIACLSCKQYMRNCSPSIVLKIL